jgi:hypothetical protein
MNTQPEDARIVNKILKLGFQPAYSQFLIFSMYII